MEWDIDLIDEEEKLQIESRNIEIDLEAISWAYQKLRAFSVGSNNMESAMMMDRLNAMLQVF